MSPRTQLVAGARSSELPQSGVVSRRVRSSVPCALGCCRVDMAFCGVMLERDAQRSAPALASSDWKCRALARVRERCCV